ncbi:MAG: outer membrane lipoprotein carrier protein LolA [Phycisphaerae bacterium]|jgi:outer membrane lipoprotein-sorting protein
MKPAHACCLFAAGLVATCELHAAQSAAQPPEKPAAESPQTQPPADSQLDAAMQAVDDRIANIEDLRANFEQRKSSAMLRQPMVSTGEVIARGDVVLWRTQQPRKSDMRVGPGEIRLLYPDDKLLEIYPVHNAKGIAGGPLPRLNELRELFTFARASEPPASASTLQVLLTPRSQELKNAVATVMVTIDTSVPCVTKIVMTDPDGEQTSVEFTQIRINTGVKDVDLALHLPEGTRESKPLEGMPAPQSPESRQEAPPAR